MRRFTLALALLAALAATAEPVRQRQFTVSITNTSLSSVAALLSRMSGRPVTVQEGLGEVRVTIGISNLNLEQAVEQIAAAAGLAVRAMGDGYLITRPEAGRPPEPLRVKLPLRHRLPSEVMALLTGDDQVFELPEGIDEIVGPDLIRAILVRGEPEAIERLRGLVDALDQPVRQVILQATLVELTTAEAEQAGLPTAGPGELLWRLLPRGEEILRDIRRAGAGRVAELAPVGVTGEQRVELEHTSYPVPEADPLRWRLSLTPRVTGEPGDESVTLSADVSIRRMSVDHPTTATGLSWILRVPDGSTMVCEMPLLPTFTEAWPDQRFYLFLRSEVVPLEPELPVIGNAGRAADEE